MKEGMSLREVPCALEPPIPLGPGVQLLSVWHGKATFSSHGAEIPGEAKVFLDLFPFPEFRFEFTPDENPSSQQLFLDLPGSSEVLTCGSPIGAIPCHVTEVGSQFLGHTGKQNAPEPDKAIYDSATFLVLNGPVMRETAIAQGLCTYLGRTSATIEGANVIVDHLSDKEQARQSVYGATHVARCQFPDPVSLSRIDELAKNLFLALSLMKCRWVGLVGPWLTSTVTRGLSFRPSVTKTFRNGDSISWCHRSMRDCFSQLAPAIATAFSKEDRAGALQTALHWLVESEQCAGGVEGAVILQQAALECLAWLEIVVQRASISKRQFRELHASEKIRRLLSLHKIQATIPDKSAAIKEYASAFNLEDLVDVLVHVRNSLVHAEPNKVTHLFARDRGSEERGNLWYLVGGILQQAFLASIGYQGQMFRRDVDAEYAGDAVRPVPWAV